MDKDKYTINVPIKIEGDFIDDIVTTALEGGITYWCEEAVPADIASKNIMESEKCFLSEILTKGGSIKLKIKDEGDDPPVPKILTLKRVLNGIRTGMEKENFTIEIFQDHDANDADAIIQYAVFNEIIFA